MRFILESPVGNTRGPAYTELLLQTLHRTGTREPVTLRIESNAGQVGLGIDCPDPMRTLLLQEIQDAYPGLKVRGVHGVPAEAEDCCSFVELSKIPDVLTLRCYEQFFDQTDGRQFTDPISGLLSAVRTGRSGRLKCSIELQITPASRSREKSATEIASILQRRFRTQWLRAFYGNNATDYRRSRRFFAWISSWFTRPATVPPQNGTETPAAALFECRLIIRAQASANASQVVVKKLADIAGVFSRFNTVDAKWQSTVPSTGQAKRKRRGFLLSAKEIATLWHPLTESTDAVSRVQRSAFREIEPPVVLPTHDDNHAATTLGRTCFRQQKNLFAIEADDLRRHLIAIGKTGTGKSSFLLNLVRQQMEANHGTVLFDPHGQLADEVLSVVPKRRSNDVIYFNAADDVAPVGFNPMVGPPGTDPTLIADGVLTSFKNVFGFDEGSAPRLLHIFRNCLLSLIGTPHASISSVQRILVDQLFRKSVIANVQNAAVRDFWLTEFHRWNDRDRTQYIASLQNKLGAFTTNERLNRILNPKSKGLVLRDIMDQSKILICNLSKGTVGHDASTLLGSLLLSSLQIAAMSRADIPEADRTDCVVVVDEFHSYLSDGNSTMADALAESRKYRTSYVLSTQMLEQLDPATLAGVLGNCGSTLCMTVGPRDAEILAGLLGSGLTPTDLMAIPKYHAYLRLLIAGASHTFSITTLPPPKPNSKRAAIIRKLSRQRYGMSVSEWPGFVV